MFKRKTVFIVGAGASHEFGLPVGIDLRNQIAANALAASKRGHSQVEDFDLALNYSQVPGIQYNRDHKLAQLANGLHTKNSIDSFLDFHRDDKELVALGKFSIAFSILKAESNSIFQHDEDGRLRLDTLALSYIPQLFSAMNDGTSRREPEKIFNNVAVISFNYDRCIEFYMFNAVKALLSCSAQDAYEIASRLEIIHPYGTVGQLWSQTPPADERDNFYGLKDEMQAGRAWQTMLTYIENMSNRSIQASMHKILSSAERIVFLGFGYLEQNLQLLAVPKLLGTAEMYGTSLNMSVPNANIARQLVGRAFKDVTGMPMSIQFIACTASKFIADTVNHLAQ